MADQKELKKRLKVLMNKPENQVCSDCTERQPRWASLIVPPPGAPPGESTIGAFMCLECSGSHRRLGVHISFVRSINLDSWKEKEVVAMENGGNAKVNAIFEARLPQSGVHKPSNHADGPTRERFIRDKYERRKFYDPNAFIEFQQPTQRFGGDPNRGSSDPSRSAVGPPSDVARQRQLERNRRLQKSSSTASDDSNDPVGDRRTSSSGQRRPPGTASNSRGASRKAPIAKAPVSAPPPTMDLLDFLSSEPAPAPANGVSPQEDFFNFNGAGGSNVDAAVASSAPAQQRRPQRTRSGDGVSAQPRRTKSKEDLASALPKKTSSTASEDILSLYQPHTRSDSIHSTASSAHLLAPSHHQSGGYDLGSITGMMRNMNVLHGGVNSTNASMQGLPQAHGGPYGMPEQQQQQPMFTPEQVMQYQQMMMMQQQQMMMRQQQQQRGGYGGQPSFGGSQPAGFQSNPMMMMGAGPSSMTGGAAPGNLNGHSNSSSTKRNAKQPDKDDPFAQFAMNAFR